MSISMGYRGPPRPRMDRMQMDGLVKWLRVAAEKGDRDGVEDLKRFCSQAAGCIAQLLQDRDSARRALKDLLRRGAVILPTDLDSVGLTPESELGVCEHMQNANDCPICE